MGDQRMENIRNRKGASKTINVPEDVRRLLDGGQIATVNLTEWLVVDHQALAASVFPEMGLEMALATVQGRLANQPKITARQAIQEVATAILETLVQTAERQGVVERLASHPSDSVRCWGAYMVGLDRHSSLQEKLSGVRPFAADNHFGVREVAWMAVRDDVGRAIDEALRHLTGWAEDPDENIRRFASEVTRPRGVWCRHIDRLKKEPWIAETLLEPLRSDAAKYVRDSVGNWLNDAGKTQREWVMTLCQRWQGESGTSETQYIVKRAMRSMGK
jgi:3-methyladenine DNA glycosylase AlkC